MMDQSVIVKNMAAAFGQLAPKLYENIKVNYKPKVEEGVSGSKNFKQKNKLKHAETGEK